MPDMSLTEFISFLALAPGRMAHENHAALERAAKVIQAETRRELGHYQDAAGPFVGWAELADSTKEDRVNQGYTPNDPGRRSGEMADNIETAIGHNEAAIGSNDDKMVWFELGTEKQPARSALGGAAFRKAEKVAEILGHGATVGLVGKDVHQGRISLD